MYRPLALLCAIGLAIQAASAVAIAPRNIPPIYEIDLETGVSDLQTRQIRAHCSNVFHLILAVGCDQPCPKDPTPPTFLHGLIPSMKARFPGMGLYYIPYNNSLNQADDSTPLAIYAAYNYVHSCPNTPVVLFGYSLGGVVMMNTLCGSVNNLNASIIAAVMYGEETYVGGQSYDAGNCTANAPKFARDPAPCQIYAPVLRSYCLDTDSDCCSTGKNPLSHFAYGQTYNNATLDFIGSQYAAYRDGSLKL